MSSPASSNPDTDDLRADMRSLLAHYTLTPPLAVVPFDGAGINNTTQLISSGAGDFILKRYETFGEAATLRYEHDLLSWLARQGLPFAVPTPTASRNGATLTPDGERWQALFPLLPGSAAAKTPTTAEAAGAALGELHRALAPYPLAPRPGVTCYDALGTIHPRIPNPWSLAPADLDLPEEPLLREALAWWRDELAQLRPLVAEIYPTLPRQVIHGDFCLANTLFDGERLTAIIDFEMAGSDARAIDIVGGLRSLLRPWNDASRIEHAHAFCRGYLAHNRLTDHEMAALPVLLRQNEVVSTIWWLGRGLAAGNVATQIRRIEQTRSLARWLNKYEQTLVAALEAVQKGG